MTLENTCGVVSWLLERLSLPEALLYGGSTWMIYRLMSALYNISPLHPLNHIPGPKLAAATYFPEFWHDVIRGGRYTHRIREMHEKYGPIVRINPDEMHCSDAAFSDEIFAAGGRRRDKPRHQIKALGGWSANVFGCEDHDTHRLRRAPVARFFSRSMISGLEEKMRFLVMRLCDKLLAEKGRGEPIDVTMAYSCLASDIISDYCFGEPFGLLSQDDWTPNFRQAGLAVVRPAYYFRFFPLLSSLMNLSTWFVNFLPEDIALFLRTLQVDIPALMSKTKAEVDAGLVSSRERPTVFVDLMQSNLPASEKTPERMQSEAVSLLGAATETTSWSLGVMTYYLLSQPETMRKLRKEIEDCVADLNSLPSLKTLESLPYLKAVIQEGLRLSYGVSSRTARIATDEDLVYRGQFKMRPVELVLPRGFAVGMSPAIMHHDESIFTDSYVFLPDRWLNSEGRRKKDLDQAFLSFSKGSRICLGMHLAMSELHLVLAALTLWVLPHMRLFETTARDVRYDHDTLNPNPVKESKGIRVVIE